MYLEITVMQSAAGYYVGRLFEDAMGLSPGTRESDYYRTRADAVSAIRSGFYLRDCPENWMAYENGDINTRPGSWYRNENYTEAS